MHNSIPAIAAAFAVGAASVYGAQQQAKPDQRIKVSESGTQPTYFVEHPNNIQPGLASQNRWAQLKNPYSGNAARIAEGAKLFVAYNCMDCHGADGSGAMGPSLQDGRMHFGGTSGEIFESIYEGRPDGMPSWGGRIGDDQIWRLVSYVESLSKGASVSTENFTGKTVDRGGR
jgi:cytochrome c oxidase cbb3-type subunit 3